MINFIIYALWCAIHPGPLDEAASAEQDSRYGMPADNY